MGVSTDLTEQLKLLNADTVSSRSDRIRLMSELRAAASRLEEPWEAVWDHNWTEPATHLAAKTLIDVGLFKKWVEAGGQDKSAEDLARLVNIDITLLTRLVRHLSVKHYLIDNAGSYGLTPWARALADEQMASLYYYGQHINIPCFNHFADFARKTKYLNPIDSEKSNWADWGGCGASVFEGFKAQPEIGKYFNDAMVVLSNAKFPWVDLYPTENIINAQKDGRVLVVDIGGGRGHDLMKMRDKHPDLPDGSLVLQDRPEVIAQSLCKAPATAQGHDFFTPQPIKGARVYFFRLVLHDWPEPEAVTILKHIADAMERGYSKLLLYETVLDATDGLLQGTTMDICMMACLSAVERTEAVWHDLAKKSGLKIVNIYHSIQAVESIIELELA